MKTLKFLFVAVLLSGFVGIAQTNAQPYDLDIMKGTHIKDVIYEVDGVQYYGKAEVEYHAVGSPYIPVDLLNWIARGPLTRVAQILEDNTLEWLNYIPLPKMTVKAYDPNIVYYEKITVGPNGMVLVNAHLPVFSDNFEVLY